MKIGASLYYVGDLQAAVQAYASPLEIQPLKVEGNWARFHLDGGDLALHLKPGLLRVERLEPVRHGAVVSLSVDDIRATLRRGRDAGFAIVDDAQSLSYGFQARIIDPWGNHIAIVQYTQP